MGRIHKGFICTTWLLALLASLLLSAQGSIFAQSSGQSKLDYVPNEILVMLKPNSSDADLAALNASLGSTVSSVVSAKHRIYRLHVPGTSTERGYTAADSKLPLAWKNKSVYIAQRNYIRRIAAQPNDTLYSSQWAFHSGDDNATGHHIYAEQAWDLLKGKNSVVVADIDTGVRITPSRNDKNQALRMPHPDLGGWTYNATSKSVVHSGGSRLIEHNDPQYTLNFGDPDAPQDPSPLEGDKYFDSFHGTMTSGVIAAKTNNNRGVAGLCWSGVWVLPLNIEDKESGALLTSNEISAILQCIDWADTEDVPGTTLKVNVINLSLGGGVSSSLEEYAVNAATAAGIVVVGSAGNDGSYFPPAYPGAYSAAISVGATDALDSITWFSQQGSALDIVAPGESIYTTSWEQYSVLEDTAVGLQDGTITPPADNWRSSFDPWGNGYESVDGTSFSAPMVSAAAALLCSVGTPGREIKQILLDTATPLGFGHPNNTYGWGLLNVEEAVKTALIQVKIQTPTTGSIIPTTRPRIRIDFRHAKQDTIHVWIDDTLVIGPAAENPTISNWIDDYYTLDTAAGKTYLLFNYNLGDSTALHRMRVTAESDVELDTPLAEPLTGEDYVTFKCTAERLTQGWHMFAIPYDFTDDPNMDPTAPETFMTDAGAVLARWEYALSNTGKYAMYSYDRSRTDAEATFAPTSVLANNLVYAQALGKRVSPSGLGYWLYVSDPGGITNPQAGASMDTASVEIGLYNGWNMVGNPFAFKVGWESVLFQYAGQTVSAVDAVELGWISPFIYRYDSVYNQYQWGNLTDFMLYPWESEWIKVKVHRPVDSGAVDEPGSDNNINNLHAPDVKVIIPPAPVEGI